MTSNDSVERPTTIAWELIKARLTAFPIPNTQINSQDWWETIIGEAPDTRTIQPRTNEQEDSGKYKNASMRLTVHPLRIEWEYSIEGALVAEYPRISTLGLFPISLYPFKELVSRWLSLDSIPSLMRLAFGAELIYPAESRVESYGLLNAYLPLNLDEEASDLIYQINRSRPSKSGIPNLKINRLSRWHSLQIVLTAEQLGMSTQYRYPPLNASRLDLDINTSAGYENELEKSALSQLFNELIELGEEIARLGDIP